MRPFLWLQRPHTLTTIIYFHGNAEDLMDIEADLQEMSDILKVNVLAVEYPGYGLLRPDGGQSRKGSMSLPWSLSVCARGRPTDQVPGETSVEGIDQAATHALTYVVSTKGIPASQVIIFGRSLGSGVALRLAVHAREKYHWSVGGIILQCPYISIKQVVSDYACSVGSFLMPAYYDNLGTLRSLCLECPAAMESKRWVPLFILHGERDEIIWPYHGHTLHEEALKHGHPTAEAFFAPNATHNKWDLHEEIIRPVGEFIQKHLPHLFHGRSFQQGHTSCFGPARDRGLLSMAACIAGEERSRISCFPASNMGEVLIPAQRDERRLI